VIDNLVYVPDGGLVNGSSQQSDVNEAFALT
jgi:hypothetical protein